MKRSALLVVALALASCGRGAPSGPQPDSLAMVEPTELTAQDDPLDDNSMTLVIDGEHFTLSAGICNTYDNGTFRFALAEGVVDSGGPATATIERFDTGDGYAIAIAVEGRHVEGTEVSWYASDTLAEHEMTASLIGGTLEGSARFHSSRDHAAGTTRALGTFAVRCASSVSPAPSPSSP